MVGWREWVALPSLGVEAIKAKIDTGARTSALHAWDQRVRAVDGEEWVSFVLHPLQRNMARAKECTERVIDWRWVTNSGGHRERRCVIEVLLRLGEHERPIEVTLSNRDEMGFRMLLGRTALSGWLAVDPARSYLVGKRKRPKRRTARRKTTGKETP